MIGAVGARIVNSPAQSFRPQGGLPVRADT
jgi:hypothetical protein